MNLAEAKNAKTLQSCDGIPNVIWMTIIQNILTKGTAWKNNSAKVFLDKSSNGQKSEE